MSDKIRTKTWKPQLLDKLHLSQVNRWHLMSTFKTQSVAEHTYGVATIALGIAQQALHSRPDLCIDTKKLLIAALEHDCDEVITGDIPSPTKSNLGWKNPIETNYSHERLNKYEKLILGFADRLECIYFMSSNAQGARARATEKDIRSLMWISIERVMDEAGGDKGKFVIAAEAYLAMAVIVHSPPPCYTLPHRVFGSSLPSKFLVAIDRRVFPTDGKKDILSLLYDGGYSVEYNCKEGHCGICHIDLMYGKVVYKGGTPSMVPNKGKVAICKAKPISNVIIRRNNDDD